MVNIAIFASGNGTNAQRMIDHFRHHPEIRIALVLSNKPDAYVLKRAENAGVPSRVFDRKEFGEATPVMDCLGELDIHFIILAGFLLLVPPEIIRRYEGRMINIHPALLPAYGGKGMYGMNVHREVLSNGDRESGITIHMVNEKYDEGRIIFQARCPVREDDTPESLAAKIHTLEYEHFPRVAEEIVRACFPLP
jgi:phosphoribosylglycinamide formyltransferase 1